MGAFTPFVHAIRDRERINDLFEELCGARLTFNYCRIGGVSLDAPPGWFDRVRGFLDYYKPMIDVFNRLITDNKIFVERLRRVAPVSAEMAIAYGLVGPNLRGSGVKFDLRKDEPYGIYPQLEFEVPVGRGYRDGVLGSCFDRYMVRIEELRQCIRIIRQCLDRIPEGEIQAKVPKVLRPAKGEVYCRTEAPRGEVGFYVISNGEKTPARVKIRTGSWSAMSIIRELSKGWMIADLVAIIGSLDVIAPEVDR
jgi:NADH-quinone oxidoreductase subunit D